MAAGIKNLCKKMLPNKKKNPKSNKSKLDETLSSSPSPSPTSPPPLLLSLSSSSSPSFSSSPSNYSGEVEKVFRYIDANNDGKISPSELRRCVNSVGAQRLTAEEAEAAVESSDSDGDGLLSLADFERLMGGDAVSEEDKTAELRAVFEAYGGGEVITAKRLKRMMSRLGESRTVKECEVMIRAYDTNGDGVLSFDEFAAMMS